MVWLVHVQGKIKDMILTRKTRKGAGERLIELPASRVSLLGDLRVVSLLMVP